MRDAIMAVIGILGFVFILGSVGACEYGDISCLSLIIRSIITFAVIFISTVILYYDDVWEAVKKHCRMKRHLRTKSKRF